MLEIEYLEVKYYLQLTIIQNQFLGTIYKIKLQNMIKDFQF